MFKPRGVQTLRCTVGSGFVTKAFLTGWATDAGAWRERKKNLESGWDPNPGCSDCLWISLSNHLYYLMIAVCALESEQHFNGNL